MSCPHASLLHLDNFANGTPWEEISRLRRQHRIVWQEDTYSPRGHWLVLHKADIEQVLKTPADFSNNFGPLLEDIPEPFLKEQQKGMTFMDPPEHRKYRSLVDFAFRPRALESREAEIRAAVRDIVDGVIDQGRCEFVEEVAMPLPMRVMYPLMGVEEEDYQRVVDLTNILSLASDPDYAQERNDGFVAAGELMAFGASLAASHRTRPRPSMTMDVLSAELDGNKLTDEQFGRFFLNLIVGGLETTRNTLSLLMHQLILHPDQFRRLQENPSLATNAVEEILRYQNTVVYLRRTATRDMTFAEEQIRKGDKLVCVIGAVNRDERYFDEPDRFDITRDPAVARRNYLTFGAGGHFCIGVHQARLSLKLMIEEIAARMDNPRLLAEPVHFKSNFMDGYKKMPIAFDRRDMS